MANENDSKDEILPNVALLMELLTPAEKEHYESHLPTEEGSYVDETGAAWELKDGQWYDHHGFTQPKEANFILGGMVCAGKMVLTLVQGAEDTSFAVAS